MHRSKPFRIGRRSFIRIGAAGTAGLYLASCGGDPVERAEALVIGTGFGGSIAALRLAEAGVGVTMLERGRRWEIQDDYDTFTTTQNPDGRCAWMHRRPVIPGVPPVMLRRSPYVGLLQKLEGSAIDVVCAAGVGGGSLAYSGLMLQPPRSLFESVFPSGVDYTEMDEVWYPRVRELMRPAPMPDDVLAADPYVSSRLFIRDAEAAGLDVERNSVAFDWELIRAELNGDIPAQCITGDYLYGLNSGAKHSIDRVGYLTMAEATGLVDVRPQHQVTAIGEGSDGRYRVDVERIDDHGEVLETLAFEADFLFLGAGSMNTTKLLLQARRDGTLPGLNDEVGANWGNNGQRILARGGLAEETGAEQGGPACIFVHHHDNPEGPIGMEFGPAPLGSEMHTLVSATQGVPERLGRLVLNADGEVTTEWERSYDESAGRAARHTLQTMIDAAGGEPSTVMGQLDDPSITFHPLGGATLGAACDLYGRVQGQPNLYVLDSALIPGSTPAGNPFWTIAAIAERCMDTIVREDFGG
ncbi:MAG TPA: GMC oxidoreductase [Sandaracinaceae bacterium LLY-WYZ-13_1]|nr:GMC oxidoreductase [Sandaracinaceae bacterium LLY-WYZ-13_1]